ncbi:ogr/Delta-like zinc finger family protein [Pseudomonas sp. RA_105y_Pfl2_P56]|uniref:ogr/Delta-like zinc finger family protein n=1 Tax=Pseudomonas sp. RA_105y_Pfl2_P56 TaxID=3088701 RepID=UPI0030D8F73D
MRVYCRECGSKALITEEEKMSSVFSKLYCQCTNARACGHSFVAHINFSHTLKPSAVKPNNSLLVRLCELPRDQQLQMFEQLDVSK